ncbi:MAG: response regulator [Geothrix sp.]|uniref:response regulator n=1 Tax=Geothrix sp. TaxID=1962974 RepID=UPI003BB0AE76
MQKRLGANKNDLFDREPVQTDVQQILAYLEELQRLRTLAHLQLRSEPPMCLGTRIELVNDQDLTFSLSFPHQVPRIKSGEVVEFHFPLGGMRFEADITYLDRGRYMESVFRLPHAIRFADRRGSRRTRIGSRENASVAIFESLVDGVAASGRLLNLSMEGLCMRMERALHIQAGKRVAPSPSLFTVGQRLQIVRILNLPHLPAIECSGEVRSCTSSQDGPVRIGIHLDSMESRDSANLHRLMLRRLPTFGRAFPVKRRRGATEEGTPGDEELDEGGSTEDPSAPEFEDPLAGLVIADPADDEPEDAGPIPEDRLIRLRRRSRRFLVIMADDLDRSIFVATLQVGGYTCFFEARNLVQGLELSKKGQVDMIFLDHQIGPLTGLEVAQRLRKMGRLDGVPICLFMDGPDVRARLSAKAAGVNHVVSLPVDFDGELRELLDRSFGLIKQ